MIASNASLPKAASPRRGRRKLLAFFALMLLGIAAAVAAGVVPRLGRQKTLAAAARDIEERRPAVNVAAARPSPAASSVDLPGDLQPVVESAIFARADGYLTKRLADIGDHVKAGQLLAVIETPELDQQISQARANLEQSRSTLKELDASLALSRANLKLAQVTLERWKRLADRGVFSRQDSDEKEAAFAVRRAETDKAQASLATAQDTVRANEANLRRLEEMKTFARVSAPFDGVVTARNVDVGTLINAGNGGPARELFRMAQIHVLRIFVNVPQTYVGAVHDGQKAELRVQELPGQVFPAYVQRISQSLDANSRSMLAILEVQNPRSILYPGMYAQVRIATAGRGRGVRIPSDAMTMNRQGARVAVVDSRGVVHFRQITISQDLGAELEVTAGLSPGELVVENPSDAIRENAEVEVLARAK